MSTKTNPDGTPPTFKEIFQEENFYKWNAQLSTVATQLALKWKEIQIRHSALFKSFTPTEAAQIAYVLGVEHSTKLLLSFLRGEIVRDTNHSNPLEQMTIATPSENKFVNVGVIAFNATLTMHQAAHYLIGQAIGSKPTTEMSDEELVAYFKDVCQQVPKTIALLQTHIPELSGEKTDEKVH